MRNHLISCQGPVTGRSEVSIAVSSLDHDNADSCVYVVVVVVVVAVAVVVVVGGVGGDGGVADCCVLSFNSL